MVLQPSLMFRGAVAFGAERPEDAAILSFPGRETPILQQGVEAV